mgnify:CR=1 FL=1
MKNAILRVLITIAFLYTILALAESSHAYGNARQVLLLNSYHPGYLWSDSIQNEIHEQLKASGKNIELSVDYLDTKRNFDLEHLDAFAESLEIKYQHYNFEVVITSDNNAFNFAIKHRERLFPGVPIVFCGFNDFQATAIENFSNITGVNEAVEIDKTIKLALNIHHNTRRLIFLSSAKRETERRNYELLLNSIIPVYDVNFKTEILLDKTIEEIEARVAQLPKDSLVFILSHPINLRLADYVAADEFTRRLTVASRVPVYVSWDNFIGSGAMGGSVITGEDQGHAAAELALKILSGIPAEELPVILESPTSNIFDYRTMQRFGISQEQIPSSSIILHKPDSLYILYKRYVWIISSIIISLITIIVFLITIILLKRRRDKFEHMAMHDQLTGLFNRHYLQDMASRKISSAIRHQRPLSLLMLDIDHFKIINDTHGHPAGDAVLQQVAKLLQEQIRDEDIIIRYGGEEFVILLDQCDVIEAEYKAQHLRKIVETLNPNKIFVSVSIGVAQLNSSDKNCSELLKRADLAVYQAKERGRNCVVIAS